MLLNYKVQTFLVNKVSRTLEKLFKQSRLSNNHLIVNFVAKVISADKNFVLRMVKFII